MLIVPFLLLVRKVSRKGRLPSFSCSMVNWMVGHYQHQSVPEAHTYGQGTYSTLPTILCMWRGVASCLFHRARTVAVGDSIKKEEGHLVEVLKTNGYPDHVIRAAARPKSGKRCEEDTPKYTICLPYVPGLNKDLRRVCRKYDIRTVFTTISTLQQQITRVKDTDPLLSRSLVVYKIPCSDCEDIHWRDQESPRNPPQRTSSGH